MKHLENFWEIPTYPRIVQAYSCYQYKFKKNIRANWNYNGSESLNRLFIILTKARTNEVRTILWLHRLSLFSYVSNWAPKFNNMSYRYDLYSSFKHWFFNYDRLALIYWDRYYWKLVLVVSRQYKQYCIETLQNCTMVKTRELQRIDVIIITSFFFLYKVKRYIILHVNHLWFSV